MKIVFLDTKTLGNVPNLEKLQQYGTVEYFEVTSPQEVIARTRTADVVITNKVVIDQNVIDQATRLKLICIAATGTNNVDLEHAKKKNIPVKNAVGYSTKSVAQATFAGLLNLIHQIDYYNRYVATGSYSNSEIFTHIHHNFWELAGKTYGIVGLGNIGREVAHIAEAFGASVIYFSTTGKNFHPEYKKVAFDELLETAAVISIHAPLSPKTLDLFGKKEFCKMKNDAILINMGRGGIVNEKELAEAIDEDSIGGAVLDVFEKEPIDTENPLLKVKRKEKLVLMPHIGWASIEARTRLVEILCSHLKNLSDTSFL